LKNNSKILIQNGEIWKIDYKKYRKEKQLWQGKFDKAEYEILDDSAFYRMPIIKNEAKEPENFYEKQITT